MYAETERPRHATWLELFFDLVYIVAIAELGAFLREGLSLVAILEYASLFVLVWWTWVGFSYYADIFDTDDLFSQLALILVMFGVIIMSQTISQALHGGSFAFAASFLLLRVLYIGLALRGWYVVPGSDKFFTYWVTFSSLSTFVWGLSLFSPVPGRFGLWISAFMLEIAGIGIVYLVFETVPVQVSHFPERLGLFTILVLGETMLAVATGTTGIDWFVPSGVTAIGGFLLVVAIWWLYFDNFDERTIDRALGETRTHWLHMRERMLVYVFGHYFIFIGIGATGVGLEAAIEAVIAAHALEPIGRTVFAGGVAAFLLGSAICHRAMPTPLHDRLFLTRITVAVAVVVVILGVGRLVAPLLVTWIIAITLVALAVFETVHRLRTPESEP
ncbi:Low temperature requirement protein LtrA [Halomicrobium zhouii]|uniref:Low temperature requirement protein LtrA n=1 Tax=Halomicrobium zhouii TaxID=767519 RepID=A0A1I6KTH7_9EURY|nr:Low temperature requirement protein LtrA [Halomicrobium zhouii]